MYNSQVSKTVLVLSFRIRVLCADLNLFDRISSVFNYTLKYMVAKKSADILIVIASFLITTMAALLVSLLL